MTAYAISYHIRGKENRTYNISVDAKDLASAKKKIGKKHKYKDGRMVVITYSSIIGYR